MLILLCIIFQSFYFTATSQVSNDEQFIINWLFTDYKNKGYFNYYLEGVKVEDIKESSDYLHLHPVAKVVYQKEIIKLFIAGVNSSNYKDDIIVFFENKVTKEKRVEYLHKDQENCNYYDVYSFFRKYKQFSKRTKLLCYEKLMENYYIIKYEERRLSPY